MDVPVTQAYIRQLSDLAMELPEEKLKRIIAFAREIKEDLSNPPLSTEEILALASERAAALRLRPRPVVEAQYQALLQALEAEVIAKGIEVEEFPDSD